MTEESTMSASKHSAHSDIAYVVKDPDILVVHSPVPVRASKRGRDDSDDDDSVASTEEFDTSRPFRKALSPMQQSAHKTSTTTTTVVLWSMLCILEETKTAHHLTPDCYKQYREICSKCMKKISPDGCTENTDEMKRFLHPEMTISTWMSLGPPHESRIYWPIFRSSSKDFLPGSVDSIRAWTKVLEDPDKVSTQELVSLIHDHLLFDEKTAADIKDERRLLRMGIWAHCLIQRPSQTHRLWAVMHGHGAPIHNMVFALLLRDQDYRGIVRQVFKEKLLCTYHLPLLCNFVPSRHDDHFNGTGIPRSMSQMVTDGILGLQHCAPDGIEIRRPNWVPPESPTSAFAQTPRTPRPSPDALIGPDDEQGGLIGPDDAQSRLP